MKNKQILISSGIVLIVVLFFVYSISNNKPNTPTIDISSLNKNVMPFRQDVLPLYEGFVWGEPNSSLKSFNGGENNWQGHIAISESNKDYGESTEAFRNFYEKEMFNNGFKLDESLSADGPGSSLWGYKRKDYYVILSYEGTELNPTGGPFDCPCTWQFSIFTGQKILNENDIEKMKAIPEGANGDVLGQPAYLIDAYTKDGKNFIEVDYVENLNGQASLKAQVEDENCISISKDDCYDSPSGYKRNRNPIIRTFIVSSSAPIAVSRYFLGTEEDNQAITFLKFSETIQIKKGLSSYSDINDIFKTPQAFINIDVKNNIVTKIVEPYQE